MSLILGVHVSRSSKVLDDKKNLSMSNAILRDIDTLGLNAAQIFTHGPRFIVENKIEYKKIVDNCYDLDLSVHSAYPSVNIWKITKENKNSKSSNKFINDIEIQLKSCKKINAWGLVLHITKHKPKQIAYIMGILKPISKKIGIKIILEMVSNKSSDDTYETPEKINYLTNLIGYKEDWWCWCVDTAHLWGAGVDIRSYMDMKKWINGIKYPEKIEMFHLNGSSAMLGSGNDKHEIPFCINDLIWNNIEPKVSGLRCVVEFSIKNSITIICEINRGIESDVIKCMDIIKSFD